MYICQRNIPENLVNNKLSRITEMEKRGRIDWPGKADYIRRMSSSPDIDATTQEIVDEFSFFDDWMQRYEYIIELGKNLDGLPDHKKDETHKVPGCQSQVWFYASQSNGRIRFEADSDAMIVRGLIALLLRVYSDRTPDEIIGTPPEFFEVLELGSHLSGSRANGLHAMVTRIHAYANAFKGGLPDDTITPEALS